MAAVDEVAMDMPALTITLQIASSIALLIDAALLMSAQFALLCASREPLAALAMRGVDAAKTSLVVIDGDGPHLLLTQISISLGYLAAGILLQDSFEQLFDIPFTKGDAFRLALCLAVAVVTAWHLILATKIPQWLAAGDVERYLMLLSRPIRRLPFSPKHWIARAPR